MVKSSASAIAQGRNSTPTKQTTNHTEKMNQSDCIKNLDKLIDNGIEASYILDELSRWLSDTQVEEFFHDFVSVNDITFEGEDNT